MSIMLIKANGDQVPFDPAKVRETLTRAGTSSESIDRVIGAIQTQIQEGMTTRALFALVKRELKRTDKHAAQRYNLRSGLLRLGPAGFKFEQYIAAVLAAYQYETNIPTQEISGFCVDHEIDVVALKDGKRAMIEAKFRNKFDDIVTLKDIMATWSRFGDLVEGGKAGKCQRFDEVWVMTNGRFSDRALGFGLCKGMHLIGWGTKERSLARLIDHASLYPITILDYLRSYEIERFSKKEMMLCSDIANSDYQKLAADLELEPIRVRRMVHDCTEIVNVAH
jgi:hypothetical protein